MMTQILYFAVTFLFHAGLLMLMLWFMIKCHDFNFTFLGLLGTAAAAGALDMIPYIGHPLAVLTLYGCLTKMTGACLFPDISFTVGVSYALMFTAKILIFTAMMGDLHLAAKEPNEAPALADMEPGNSGANVTNAPSVATAPKPIVKSKVADDIVRQLNIKGVTRNGDKSAATFKFAGKSHTLFLGDTTVLQVADKPVKVKLERVQDLMLTFNINGETANCLYQ